jgi:hypothetical protein
MASEPSRLKPRASSLSRRRGSIEKGAGPVNRTMLVQIQSSALRIDLRREATGLRSEENGGVRALTVSSLKSQA